MRGVLAAVAIAVCCILSGRALGSADAQENSRDFCHSLVTRWVQQEMQDMEASPPQAREKLRDLLFFLHIPRTGGRNYNQCFLRMLFNDGEACPRSYDKLRLDPSNPQCTFLSTHDDYSVVSMLPKSLTSVITNLRSPTGRVLSAYEFSIEVASRFYMKPSLAFRQHTPFGLRKGGSRIAPLLGSKAGSTSTLDIWPWKYLVPLMQRDIFDRRDLRDSGALEAPKTVQDVYDVAAFAMPVKEFIESPEAIDLVHNGATFQVAGLTNNSYLPEANALRSCATRYEDLGHQVLSVAKTRLDRMLYVGLTERHKESADLFAHLVGHEAVQRRRFKETKETNKTLDKTVDVLNGNYTSYEELIDRMVKTYQKCSNTLRSTQVGRRISSLRPIAPVNFSSEARKNIPDDVMARIVELNSLDVALYEHGKKIFARERKYVKDMIERPKRVDVLVLEKRSDALQQSANLLIGLSILLSLSGLFFCFHSFTSGPRGGKTVKSITKDAQ